HGDCRRRPGDGARLRLRLGAACRRSRRCRDGRTARRRAHRQAAQPAQGRYQEGAGRIRSARGRRAHRPSRRRHQRQRPRAQDKLGDRLFAPGIRIIDDPLRRRGLRSRPFDAEGVAGRALAVVEDGQLQSWFLDSATARELGLKTTGHAQRGVSSAPSPGATNLHLAPGSVTPDALIADIDDGFYVNDLIGMGVNLVTGDYSRGAAGFWIEPGDLTYPGSEVTIAGHLFDVFRTLTPANDLAFRYGTNAPTVRVEGLTVAGH